MRILVLGMMLAGLGTLPQSASAQAGEAETTSEPNLEEPSPEPASEAPVLQVEPEPADVDVVPSPVSEDPEALTVPEDAAEAPTSAADSYGIRYVQRQLVMPQGMVRGTFDMTVGNIEGLTSIAFDFGAAIAPANHIEIGFSRYRMGSFPSPTVLGAFGGRGLIPVIAEGSDFVPLTRTNSKAFGDIVAYVRGEPPIFEEVVDIAFDLGFLIPTASNFGMLVGLPIRFHGGKVAAIDTGVEILINDIGEEFGSVVTISVPVNLVFNVTDEGFVMLNSGFSALDVGEEFPLKTFPLGVGVGYTVATRRSMFDLFATFSWPAFGTLLDGPFEESTWENITGVTAVTIGANFYSPVLFRTKRGP